MSQGRQSTPKRPVFVLGAGFTKAFLTDAPLLVGDFDCDDLARRFRPFEAATQLLSSERARHPRGYIDIERLMTRLDSGMPYDSVRGNEPELRLLLSELRRVFLNKLEAAKSGPRRTTQLARLARHIVKNKINCITFNYDDVLDEALWRVRSSDTEVSKPYWHPDGGYGFFCAAPESCVQATANFMDRSSMALLKLHGSVNWRPRLGAIQPYEIGALVHLEPWRKVRLTARIKEADARAIIQRHLERDAFIIPPVLVKADLVRQPVLKLVWSRAYELLARASEVVFVGYRLPVTDLAASFLFRESLAAIDPKQVTIVGRPRSKRREELIRAFQEVLPGLDESRFRWDGALAWSKRIVAT